jgi:hypothetical protein
MKSFSLPVVFALALAVPPLHAQTCADVGFCTEAVIAEITQARVGIGLSGGNPILGASSTAGIRLGAIPRLSLSVRVTGVQLSIPNAETTNATDELKSIARSFNVDASIGVFSGFSLLPTVGGFASVDVLASYGKMSLSEDDGYTRDPDSWAVGVRLGILRESFTAPGISVSATYRKFGDVRHIVGEPELDAGTITTLDNGNAFSLRGTIGKRILMLGAVAGLGYDRYSSDIRFVSFVSTRNRDFTNSGTTVFANLSWTMLILHVVGEGGVQRGGGENAFYGSLALRLAL